MFLGPPPPSLLDSSPKWVRIQNSHSISREEKSDDHFQALQCPQLERRDGLCIPLLELILFILDA